MNIVVTMAGLGTRFQKAGYTMPKYQIEVRGRSLFSWSMLSLRDFFDEEGSFVFVMRKDPHSEAFVKRECDALGIRGYTFVTLDAPTDGQATTALYARSAWKPKKALLIYNIDTYVEEGWIQHAQFRGDGFIPCFLGKGNHWSFVRLGPDGRAAEVREKERIAPHCTIGAYYFRSAALYEGLYEEYYTKGQRLEKGERYVAPLYNLLIARGGAVYIADLPPERIHVLGTPEEVDAFRAQERRV